MTLRPMASLDVGPMQLLALVAGCRSAKLAAGGGAAAAQLAAMQVCSSVNQCISLLLKKVTD